MAVLRWGVLLLAAQVALSAATVAQDRQEKPVYRFECPAAVIEVDAAAGGRIRSWKLLPGGREVIALWHGAGEIGGALDDRAVFTGVAYDAAIMTPGPVAVLRLTARQQGFELVKRLELDDTGVLRVGYEFANGTQAAQRLMIRSMLLPGTHPQTQRHLYWVHGSPEQGEHPTTATPDASEYYRAAVPEYAALWDQATGDGLTVYAPGAERFYFWRGSREFPTFEWLYPDLPAGKTLTATVAIAGVQAPAAPDWAALVKGWGNVPGPRLADLPGWADEATRFGVTPAERQRGFWLSTGEGPGKQRLPELLPIDLPREETRYVPVTINALATRTVPLRAEVAAADQATVTVFRDTPGPERRELRPLPTGPLPLQDGRGETLWLRVSGGEPGQRRVPLTLHVGDAAATVTLDLHVWPVRVEAVRPFHLRGYNGGFPVWSGYDVTPAALARLEVILQAYAAIGGDVIEWETVLYKLLAHAQVGGRPLSEVAPTLDPAKLPELDFAYYDPIFALCRKYGVTRLETYLDPPANSQWQWRFLDAAFGKNRVKVGTPEAERAIVWLYQQQRKYFAERGLQADFCKIADEIAPEQIPQHLATAKLARAAGWRPYTTITGMIARSAGLVNELQPWCDEWQLAFGLKDDFLRLRDERYELVDQVMPLTVNWGPYGNGGARDTWAARIFGPGGASGLDPESVESVALLEDDRPLELSGESAWGNTTRGKVFTSGRLNSHLWLSPRAGDPAAHRYTLKLKLRRPSPQGRPLITLKPTDEVWCYGGGAHPYRQSYGTAWQYPVMTLWHGFAGYGLWAFYHWNSSEHILWLDDANRVTISPAYAGYQDGWHDALLLAQLQRHRGRAALEAVAGPAPAPLRVGVESQEIYHYRTVLNRDDPLARNAGRRAVLTMLSPEAAHPE